MAFSAFAADVPILKSRTVVSKNIVTIGDLFHNAGTFAHIPVFEAPDPGVVGTVKAQDILAEIQPHGLYKVDNQGLSEIIVLRADNVITKKDIENKITDSLSEKFGIGTIGDLEISFNQPVQDLPTDQLDTELQVEDIRYQRASGAFSITLKYQSKENDPSRQLTYSGTLLEMVDAPILLSSKRRGDIIQPSDISFERKSVSKVGSNAIINIADLKGMELRRSLRVGSLITQRDIKHPTLVSRNDIVSVIYSQKGLTLTTRGRALESGAKGDMVTIINGESRRTLKAMVRDRGQVIVTSAAF